MTIVYENPYFFDLEDVKKSHSQLLLRKQKSDINKSPTIDLIFGSVQEIRLPMFIEGLRITVEELYDDDKMKIFHIIPYNGNELGYFIRARYMAIYENELGFGETTLGFNNSKKRGTLINEVR